MKVVVAVLAWVQKGAIALIDFEMDTFNTHNQFSIVPMKIQSNPKLAPMPSNF